MDISDQGLSQSNPGVKKTVDILVQGSGLGGGGDGQGLEVGRIC